MDDSVILNYLLKVLKFNEYKQYPDEDNKGTQKSSLPVFEYYIYNGKLKSFISRMQ